MVTTGSKLLEACQIKNKQQNHLFSYEHVLVLIKKKSLIFKSLPRIYFISMRLLFVKTLQIITIEVG